MRLCNHAPLTTFPLDSRYGHYRDIRTLVKSPFRPAGYHTTSYCFIRSLCLCKLTTEGVPSWPPYEALRGKPPFDPGHEGVYFVCGVVSSQVHVLTCLGSANGQKLTVRSWASNSDLLMSLF